MVGDQEAFRQATAGAQKAQEALYRLLKGVYGEAPAIEELKPEEAAEDAFAPGGQDDWAKQLSVGMLNWTATLGAMRPAEKGGSKPPPEADDTG